MIYSPSDVKRMLKTFHDLADDWTEEEESKGSGEWYNDDDDEETDINCEHARQLRRRLDTLEKELLK